MGSNQRKERLKNFLHKFNEAPINLFQNNQSIGPMQEFLLTYFGKCFIQGYRIMQRIENKIFILSLMEFQNGGNSNFITYRQHANKKHGKYKIINVELNQKKINQDRQARSQYFKKIKQIIQFFCGNQTDTQDCQGIQVVFLFADNFQVSTPNFETLSKGSALVLQKFYHRDYGIDKKEQKSGLKTLDEKQEGTKLHELVQLLFKGAGQIRNKKYFTKSVLHQSKFSYNLWMVINSICLVVGKQMIEGGYITISSEKWMRKFSQKKFKKFDLLLRNQKKVCIIDWKFSRMNANQKITTQAFAQKNLRYFQLARQDYNAEVQLKFYCFHKTCSSTHHKFTVANYKYNIQEIEINDYIGIGDGVIQIESDSSVDVGPRTKKKSLKNRFKNNMKINDESFQNQDNQQKIEKQPKIFKRLQPNQTINKNNKIYLERQRIDQKQRQKQKQQLQLEIKRKKMTQGFGSIIYDPKTQTFVFADQIYNGQHQLMRNQNQIANLTQINPNQEFQQADIQFIQQNQIIQTINKSKISEQQNNRYNQNQFANINNNMAEKTNRLENISNNKKDTHKQLANQNYIQIDQSNQDSHDLCIQNQIKSRSRSNSNKKKNKQRKKKKSNKNNQNNNQNEEIQYDKQSSSKSKSIHKNKSHMIRLKKCSKQPLVHPSQVNIVSSDSQYSDNERKNFSYLERLRNKHKQFSLENRRQIQNQKKKQIAQSQFEKLRIKNNNMRNDRPFLQVEAFQNHEKKYSVSEQLSNTRIRKFEIKQRKKNNRLIQIQENSSQSCIVID